MTAGVHPNKNTTMNTADFLAMLMCSGVTTFACVSLAALVCTGDGGDLIMVFCGLLGRAGRPISTSEGAASGDKEGEWTAMAGLTSGESPLELNIITSLVACTAWRKMLHKHNSYCRPQTNPGSTTVSTSYRSLNWLCLMRRAPEVADADGGDRAEHAGDEPVEHERRVNRVEAISAYSGSINI